MNSNKGQITSLQIIVVGLVFLILWPFLAPTIDNQGQSIAVQTQAVGVEAFVLLNLNIAIFFMFLLFILAVGFFGGLLK
jgi:hypothetical protein